jgi:D-serine deaminase-like pyridoxal phosphate-dependent protein
VGGGRGEAGGAAARPRRLAALEQAELLQAELAQQDGQRGAHALPERRVAAELVGLGLAGAGLAQPVAQPRDDARAERLGERPNRVLEGAQVARLDAPPLERGEIAVPAHARRIAAVLIGTPLIELDTPTLLLDLAAFERNLARMAEFSQRTGVAHRPHAKSHKSPLVARKQLDLGAVGITCSKLGEAEVLVAGGVTKGILISSEVVGPVKIARLLALARHAELIVVIDDAANAGELSAAAERAGIRLDALVEVNVGQERCGVLPGAPAAELARAVAALPGLRFRGLQGYEGHLQSVRDLGERTARCNAAMAQLVDTRRLVESSGLTVEIVSTAGTGTHEIAAEHPGVTEVQPGSYVWMDASYMRVEGTPFESALSVLVSVVSRQRPGQAIVDAGWKALSTDAGNPSVKGRPDLAYAPAGDEHGRVTGDNLPPVGGKIEMLPSHCDTTVNLYDRFVCIRDGHVETVWPVAARGRTQ